MSIAKRVQVSNVTNFNLQSLII